MLMSTQSPIIVIRAVHFNVIVVVNVCENCCCQKNKIQCCSVDGGVGLLLELLKLLMSQEQDSMLFCLMLVKDCGQSESENCMSMINVKRTRFNVVLLMLELVCCWNC